MHCFKNCLRLLVVFTVLAAAASGELVDHWGLRAASLAVVNTALPSPLRDIISLRGDWDFVTDPMLMGRHRMGKGPAWNEPDWSGLRALAVPGCWEAQGVGEPGMSLPWDLPFDCIPRPLNHVYMGTARYRRSVDIPEDWQGKRVWLKVGGVRSEAWLWVNQQRVAHINTYCGAYKYDVTDLARPGAPLEIVAAVRNDSPSRKGCQAAFHRFGGFYRDIELEAAPSTWIDDLWVRGDFDRQVAEAHVLIQREGADAPSQVALEIAVKTGDGAKAGSYRQELSVGDGERAELVCEIPLSEFRPWSPETPHLYLAEATLTVDGAPIHGWTERFGVRKLEVVGNAFYLNGRPFFVRGYGDDYIYPLTLTSPADREFHLRHLNIARRAGFNYVRLHTHCEIPEFFEAADEAGILVQPELPYYHDIAAEGFVFDPMRDLQELHQHYRRYVSFASYSTGNEGHLGSPLDVALYQWAKKNDPDRLFQHQDGGCNNPDNSDYLTPNGYGLPTSIVPWTPGAFDEATLPFIAHEYLNLGIKMDPRIAPKFAGAIPAPRSLADYEASLQAAGLDRAWGDACLDAAHGLQGYYQKRGIEQARLDPACDGYSYWTIVDVMVPQGGTYTGQGFLNAFWEEKSGGLTLDEFCRFNGPTAILADMPPDSAIAVSGDSREAALWISHFTPETWAASRIAWTLAADAETFAEGVTEPFEAVPGDVKAVGAATFTVPELTAPVQARLAATIVGTDVANSWDFWFFPKRTIKDGSTIAVTADLFETLSQRYSGLIPAESEAARSASAIVGSWDHPDLIAPNAQGKRRLMIGPADGPPNISLGWWHLGNQIGTAFANHPVFGDFPHNGKLTPLWFRLIKQGLSLPMDPQYGSLAYFAVGEGQQQYFAYVLEKQGTTGPPLLMTHGMDLTADTPEGAYLLDAMIAYMQGDACGAP